MTASKAIMILNRTSKCRTENCPEEYDCAECDYGVSVDDCVEAIETAIEALKDSEPKFHLQCLRCRKDVGVYSAQTMEQVSYTHYSYCEDCLRKGLKMLKKADAEKANNSEIPNSSDDLISRQAAIDALMEKDKKLRNINWYDKPYAEAECIGIDKALSIISNLPSAQPERKTGHWIGVKSYSVKCSVCGNYSPIGWASGLHSEKEKRYSFCPYCGAKMEGDVNDDPE